MGQPYYVLIAISIVLVTTQLSYADRFYTITMRNGSQLTTSQYWEDSGWIMFYIYNGIMGLQKGFVKTISERQLNVSEEMMSPHTSRATIGIQESTGKSSPNVLDVKKDQQSVATRSDEYDHALASIKSDFTRIHLMTTDEIYAFSSKLSALKKKMIQDQVAHMYTEIFSELYAIGDEMEDILKTRGQ